MLAPGSEPQLVLQSPADRLVFELAPMLANNVTQVVQMGVTQLVMALPRPLMEGQEYVMTLSDKALVTEAGPVAAVESTFRVYSGFGVGEYTTMLPAVGPQGEVDETDTVRPSVIAQYPAHFSTDLPKQTDVVFQLTFSEPIVLHPGAYVQVHYRGDDLRFGTLADNVTIDRLVVHNDMLQFK